MPETEKKKEIIDSLHKIICTATSTRSDSRVENNDYFKRRVLGFKAEIEFVRLIEARSNTNFFEGGQFISKKLTGEIEDRNKFIYTTVAFNSPEDFKDIYSKISEWSEVDVLIYIKVEESGWGTTMLRTRQDNPEGRLDSDEQILIPKYVFYQFNKALRIFEICQNQDFQCVLSHFTVSSRRPNLNPLRKREQFDYFSEYGVQELKSIYANRYFLDVVLRQASGRQIIDLDGFLKKQGNYYIVEIKEKSPITNDSTDQSQWQFGWDSRRILWYLYLKMKLNLPVIYNVREINNREEREFVQWDSILIENFLNGTSWSNSRGGGGGEDTLLAPYLFFSRPDDVLNSLE